MIKPAQPDLQAKRGSTKHFLGSRKHREVACLQQLLSRGKLTGKGIETDGHGPFCQNFAKVAKISGLGPIGRGVLAPFVF